MYLHRAHQTTQRKNVCTVLLSRFTVKHSLCVHKQYSDLKKQETEERIKNIKKMNILEKKII